MTIRNIIAAAALALFWLFVLANERGYLGNIFASPPPPAEPSPRPTTATASPVAPPTPTAVPEAALPTLIPPAPTTSPVNTPAFDTRVVVANTGGDGATLRRTPAGDSIRALREGTELTVVGSDARTANETWRNVRDPAGNVGWVRADLLAPAPPTTPTTTRR